MRNSYAILALGLAVIWTGWTPAAEEEPAAVNPFGSREKTREDSLPGYVELSDGLILPGQVYLTRDTRLQIYDESLQRQREVPLHVIHRMDATVEKEWMEKEWRFKENANDEKVYTGRAYPSRLLAYTISLKDGPKITGPVSGIVYVDSPGGGEPKKFLLNKRQKGTVGTDLPSLVYLRTVELGEEAFRSGQLRASQERAGKKDQPTTPRRSERSRPKR